MAGSCQLEACMVRQPFRPFQGSLPLLARSIPGRWRIKDIPEQFKSAVYLCRNLMAPTKSFQQFDTFNSGQWPFGRALLRYFLKQRLDEEESVRAPFATVGLGAA